MYFLDVFQKILLNFNVFYLHMLLIYYFPAFILLILAINHKITTLAGFLKLTNQSVLFKIFIYLFILNLCGVPPLPGFFIKLSLIKYLSFYQNILITLILILYNFIIFYFFLKNIKFFSLYKESSYFLGPLTFIELTLIYLCIYFFIFFFLIYPFFLPFFIV